MDNEAQNDQDRDQPEHLQYPQLSRFSPAPRQFNIPFFMTPPGSYMPNYPNHHVYGAQSYSQFGTPVTAAQPHYLYPGSWWAPQTQPSSEAVGYPGYNTYQDPSSDNHGANSYYPPYSPTTDLPSEASTPMPDPLPPENSRDSISRVPAKSALERTHWVMWVGNLPSKTTREEVHRFFSSESDNIASIFVIQHSNCAFVNLKNEEVLHRCVAQFHGQKLRPHDERCPRLVCRVRTTQDDFNAGVGGQRKARVHKDTIRSSAVALADRRPFAREFEVQSTDYAVSRVPGPARVTQSPSSASTDSTTSSFLAQHFPRRFFILKCFRDAELDESALRTGLWTTQVHNEFTLNRAFRTSTEVILFFSRNGSGAFYGYARMAGPIADHAMDSGSSLSTSSSHERMLLSELGRASSEPTKSQPRPVASRGISTSPPVISSLGTGSKKSKGKQKQKPHLQDSERSTSEPSTTSRGTPFQVEWLCTERLPFRRTRHITNPWTEGREVKISRDGTELHPHVGSQLLEAWTQMIQLAAAERERKKKRGFPGLRRP